MNREKRERKDGQTKKNKTTTFSCEKAIHHLFLTL